MSRKEAWELFEAQDKRCALSGVPLKFSTNIRDQRGTQTASLDRIDSSKGYVLGNVQWVHKKVNIMKNVMPEVELLEWCERVLSWSHHKTEKLARPSVGRGLPVVHTPT